MLGKNNRERKIRGGKETRREERKVKSNEKRR